MFKNEIDMMMNYAGYFLFGIGVLSFVVSIIVQAIKEQPYLKDLPTSLLTLVISFIVTIASVAVLCSHYKTQTSWAVIYGSIVLSFIVYLISTGGWEKAKEIWNRMRYPGGSK